MTRVTNQFIHKSIHHGPGQWKHIRIVMLKGNVKTEMGHESVSLLLHVFKRINNSLHKYVCI